MGGRSLLLAFVLVCGVPAIAAGGPAQDLSNAIAHQDIRAVDAALAESPPIDASDHGVPFLVLAAISKRADLVKLLLAHGANPNVRSNSENSGMAPIHAAAAVGAVDVVNVLLDSGVSIESGDDLGDTPLEIAAARGQSRSIALLYARGARLSATNKYGMTALHYAAGSGNRETVALLISLGADVNVKDAGARTPYDLAAASNTLTSSDKANVLAILAPAQQTVEPARTHGCPRTHEELAWFFSDIRRRNPGLDALTIAGAVEQELKMLGCAGS